MTSRSIDLSGRGYLDTTSRRRTQQEQRAAQDQQARLFVATQAHDADDLALLLDVLGLAGRTELRSSKRVRDSQRKADARAARRGTSGQAGTTSERAAS